tara:strand:+ start:647 stop:772 length:126 start_codon:yes stop_codon:yes gene_type:complete
MEMGKVLSRSYLTAKDLRKLSNSLIRKIVVSKKKKKKKDVK